MTHTCTLHTSTRRDAADIRAIILKHSLHWNTIYCLWWQRWLLVAYDFHNTLRWINVLFYRAYCAFFLFSSASLESRMIVMESGRSATKIDCEGETWKEIENIKFKKDEEECMHFWLPVDVVVVALDDVFHCMNICVYILVYCISLTMCDTLANIFRKTAWVHCMCACAPVLSRRDLWLLW